MRAFNRLLLLTTTLATANVVLAQREDSLQVFSQLKQLQISPLQKRSRSSLADLADFVTSNQAEILLADENFIQISIQKETSLLNKLTGIDVQASGPECVQFIRNSTTLLMNLAGISYTNCLNRADERVFNELSKIDTAQITREKYNLFSLLGSFCGENIFIDPVAIRNKLSARLRTRADLPAVPAATTTSLKVVFNDVITEFRTCMADAQTSLASNLAFTAEQVRAICAAQTSEQI